MLLDSWEMNLANKTTPLVKKGVMFMVLRIKIIIAKLIRKICCISPKWGNRVMDILGYDNYCRVAKYWK